MPVVYSLLKAKAIRLWPEAYHLFKTELLSISVGLRMYAKASPFSLTLAMLVRDQVLSLLSELKERSHELEGSIVALNWSISVWIEFSIGMAHCLLRDLDFLSIAVVVLL